MIKLTILPAVISLFILSCNSPDKNTIQNIDGIDLEIVGAMNEVMWKGELGPSIKIDTISTKRGLYGLGPQSYLRGELLINNGEFFVSKVISDSTMVVEKAVDLTAPFFVYANVTKWKEVKIPGKVKSVSALEKFIEKTASEYQKPFAFKLTGELDRAVIHIQNLPKGIQVSSPEQAHQGQVDFELLNERAEIIGFFSKKHKGVFTHHDSFLHMHLILEDESKMGHLDELDIGQMKLHLPLE